MIISENYEREFGNMFGDTFGFLGLSLKSCKICPTILFPLFLRGLECSFQLRYICSSSVMDTLVGVESMELCWFHVSVCHSFSEILLAMLKYCFSDDDFLNV